MPSSLTRVLPFVSGFSPRPPASVSGTGAYIIGLSTFSRRLELTCFSTCLRSRLLSSSRRPYFTNRQTRSGNAVDHHRAHAILPCQCFSYISGAGISTCSPSATTSVLTLGPDLPWADEPSPGNLGLSTAVFLARLSLLIPALSLLYSPRILSVSLLPVHIAPLPITLVIPPLRRHVLAPDIFGAALLDQ